MLRDEEREISVDKEREISVDKERNTTEREGGRGMLERGRAMEETGKTERTS